ncbi:hypothetical protein [Acetobacter malorum]|uniref:hypothetical protein n=1 Tax=Acetobacter malorum TaxID=178901 RepID=UPI00248ECF67|nr:hypothetical protein [Acetobacter malorum]
MSEELKACDCGMGTADLMLWEDSETGSFHIWCLNCDEEAPKMPTQEEAVNAWNTRAGEKA